MLVSSRVTLAVAPVSALMVTLLVVEAEESRFRMTGAESSLVTPPWLTFWPLSVAETVMLPSSRYQVSAIATVGRKTAISARETSRVKSFRMFIVFPPYSGKVLKASDGVQTIYIIDRKKLQEKKRINFGSVGGMPRFPCCKDFPFMIR